MAGNFPSCGEFRDLGSFFLRLHCPLGPPCHLPPAGRAMRTTMGSFWAGLEVACSAVLMFHWKDLVTCKYLPSWNLTPELGRSSLSYCCTSFKTSSPKPRPSCLTSMWARSWRLVSRSWNKQGGPSQRRPFPEGGGNHRGFERMKDSQKERKVIAPGD